MSMALTKQGRKVLRRLRRNFGGRGSKIVGGTQQYVICPIHFFEHTASLSINIESGVCYCFGCGWAGRITDLARLRPEVLARNALITARVEVELKHTSDREKIFSEPDASYDDLFGSSPGDDIPF
jgi:hypothetical protein